MASGFKQIKFTKVAQVQLKNIIEYIVREFGETTAEKFLQSLKKKLNDIASQKISYRYFLKSRRVHYFILSKNYVLYTENKKTVSVVGIYGSRQQVKKK
jgi:plasmid stabilization system protein ParE